MVMRCAYQTSGPQTDKLCDGIDRARTRQNLGMAVELPRNGKQCRYLFWNMVFLLGTMSLKDLSEGSNIYRCGHCRGYTAVSFLLLHISHKVI